jgi:hypothetical protein
VEALLEKRMASSRSKLLPGPQVEYLVKWKKWDDTHNSWEKADNLGGCEELVRGFEEAEQVRGRALRARRRAGSAMMGMMRMGPRVVKRLASWVRRRRK